MKVLVWDDGFLGSKEDNNIVRELHSVTPACFAVTMKDGTVWQYNNAVSIHSMYCPKCLIQIPEDCIGRENDNVKSGFTCYCKKCDTDLTLEEVLYNDEISHAMR